MRPKRSPDPALDGFREGVASLWHEDELAGHVATVVEAMWAPFRRQAQVWILVTWADGRREPIYEDYEPWTSVAELEMGHLLLSTPQGDIDFDARWLEGKSREAAWARFGIHDQVGAYMGETQP